MVTQRQSPGYVPDLGDIVWLSFDPQARREQAGRRPAIGLSPAYYNRRSGLALFCPVTSQVKGYPFEVQLPAGGLITGVVPADQIKSLDWQARRARFVARAEPGIVEEVLGRVQSFLS